MFRIYLLISIMLLNSKIRSEFPHLDKVENLYSTWPNISIKNLRM